MRIILSQRFPLGRFHANPWKAFVFDDPYGEWPPSPWRLLRALIARSYQLQREQPEIDTPQREALVRAICSSTISWQLPDFSWRGPGLRQYLPTEFKRVPAGAKEPGRMTYGTSKTQDNFWLTPDSAPPLHWILETDQSHWTPEVLSHLDACLARITYFGRAESITDISRIQYKDTNITANCFLRPNRTATTVPVLCLRPDAILDQVQLTTDDKSVSDASCPPGAIWLFAERPALPKRKPRSTNSKPAGKRHPVQTMQFALGGRVFPPEQSWIRITEKFRGAVLAKLAQSLTGNPNSRFGDLSPSDRAKFSLMTGKTDDDTPLGGHQHTCFFIVPDEGGQPTRLVCHRHTPFTTEEQNAMLAASERSLAWEYGSDDWQLRLVPLHAGTPLPENILGTAQAWVSLTPYVPTRHILGRNGKPKAGCDITSQILADLNHRGLPPATLNNEIDAAHHRWVKVHRPQRARTGQTNDIKRGYHLRLRFDQPIQGPLALGHSAHFGLGLFTPVLE